MVTSKVVVQGGFCLVAEGGDYKVRHDSSNFNFLFFNNFLNSHLTSMYVQLYGYDRNNLYFPLSSYQYLVN